MAAHLVVQTLVLLIATLIALALVKGNRGNVCDFELHVYSMVTLETLGMQGLLVVLATLGPGATNVISQCVTRRTTPAYVYWLQDMTDTRPSAWAMQAADRPWLQLT